MNDAAYIVFNSFSHSLLVVPQLGETLFNGLLYAALLHNFQQRHIIEGRNDARFRGLYIAVQQITHVGLKGLEVQYFSAGHAHGITQMDGLTH